MYEVMNRTHEIDLPGIRFERLSLHIDQGLPFEKWAHAVEEIMALEGAFRWWIGKLLNYGESAYGEKYAQAVDLTGLSYDTVVDYCYVERNVSSSVRTDELSWSHHKLVAPMPVIEQRRWLQMAIDNGWTLAEFRRQIKQASLAALDGTYARSGSPQANGYDSPSDTDGTPQGAPTQPHERWDEDDEAIDPGDRDQVVYTTGEATPESCRFSDAAQHALPDLTFYNAASGIVGYPPYGNVMVDLPTYEQEMGFGLLRAAFDRGDVPHLIFVMDGSPFEVAQHWYGGAICLTERGTIFYMGDAVSHFAEAFQTEGVIVIPWRAQSIQRTEPHMVLTT